MEDRLSLKIITEPKSIDPKVWNNFIYNHPNGNIFQSHAMYNFFMSIDNYFPVVLAAFDGKDNLKGILLAATIKESDGIKGSLSKRCIVWSGPLVLDDSNTVLNLLLNTLNKFVGKKTIYTEIRNNFDNKNFTEKFISNGYRYVDHLNFIVSISTVEENKKKLSSSKRRQINKSLKNGAKIIMAENLEQVQGFYELLSNLYSIKVKKPLPSFNFFKQFYLCNNLGKYFLILYEDNIVGGIMCPIYKDTIYEWYICGEDEKYKEIYPSVLATWAPIDYAANNGLEYLDFMGAGKPDEDYGVRKFKSQFGGELVNYGRFLKINKPVLYRLGKAGLKLYNKFK